MLFALPIPRDVRLGGGSGPHRFSGHFRFRRTTKVSLFLFFSNSGPSHRFGRGVLCSLVVILLSPSHKYSSRRSKCARRNSIRLLIRVEKFGNGIERSLFVQIGYDSPCSFTEIGVSQSRAKTSGSNASKNPIMATDSTERFRSTVMCRFLLWTVGLANVVISRTSSIGFFLFFSLSSRNCNGLRKDYIVSLILTVLNGYEPVFTYLHDVGRIKLSCVNLTFLSIRWSAVLFSFVIWLFE